MKLYEYDGVIKLILCELKMISTLKNSVKLFIYSSKSLGTIQIDTKSLFFENDGKKCGIEEKFYEFLQPLFCFFIFGTIILHKSSSYNLRKYSLL